MIDQVVKFILNASDSEIAFVEQAILFRKLKKKTSAVDEMQLIEKFPTGASWSVEKNKELWKWVKNGYSTYSIAKRIGKKQNQVSAQISKLRKFMDESK